MIYIFITGLVLAGITTFPIRQEMEWLMSMFGEGGEWVEIFPSLSNWIRHIAPGVFETSEKYPYLFYGFDWLGFAHIVIAVAFIGPLRDPVRNIWVIEFGMIACLMVIPAVLLFAVFRGIPWYWQIIDCSFGVFGLIPLWWVRRWILQLEALQRG